MRAMTRERPKEPLSGSPDETLTSTARTKKSIGKRAGEETPSRRGELLSSGDLVTQRDTVMSKASLETPLDVIAAA